MKLKGIVRTAGIVLLVALAVHVAAPAGTAEDLRTCAEAFQACCRVAAVVGAIYYIYCLEGYVFCKRFIEK